MLRLSAGASPRPTYARQVEHPAVHRMQLSWSLPKPTKIRQPADPSDLPVVLCYSSVKDIALCGRDLSLSKNYSLMKKKRPPVSMFLGKRQPLLWCGFCRAEDYAAQTKGRAGKVLGGRLCGGSRSGQRLPSRFFATFLAGTRKVGPAQRPAPAIS